MRDFFVCLSMFLISCIKFSILKAVPDVYVSLSPDDCEKELVDKYLLEYNKTKAIPTEPCSVPVASPHLKVNYERVTKWPNATVYYKVSGKFNQTEKAMLCAAITLYHQLTCVRFVQCNKAQLDKCVKIQIGSCGSDSVGMAIQNNQDMFVKEKCKLGGYMHELMHVLGFYHEHTRFDRDSYITVVKANTLSSYLQPQFYPKWSKELGGNVMGEYEFASIMHYAHDGYTGRTLMTVNDPKKYPNAVKQMGQRLITPLDKKKLHKFYGCDQVVKGRKEMTSEKRAASSPCADVSKKCEIWTEAGFCNDISPVLSYMQENCRKACKVCK